ncbi:hypothetical protein E1B28_012410 [Marasmius oreades]|uniref:Uncharacterized protein n=1 Tax=Marasmius oreades TaxID=181124 RepID=A0A9P7UNN8_9AGAR|nr:uncharacterized protein E1B28_012410 [Marasmius oreades]KAG7088413.1 hypothetical protein E1B28_012410 [Marasmius oreades]
MKTFILFTLSLVLSVLSQSIQITEPTDGTPITPGQSLNVMLEFPNSLTGMTHVSVVVSTRDCTQECSQQDASDSLGKPLYVGDYAPQFHENNKPPYQNFTVKIPQGITTAKTQLTVAHFMLVGASASPLLEYKNVTLAVNSAQVRRSLLGRILV